MKRRIRQAGFIRFETWEVVLLLAMIGFGGYLFFRGLEFLCRHIHVTVEWQ